MRARSEARAHRTIRKAEPLEQRLCAELSVAHAASRCVTELFGDFTGRVTVHDEPGYTDPVGRVVEDPQQLDAGDPGQSGVEATQQLRLMRTNGLEADAGQRLAGRRDRDGAQHVR